MKIFQIFLINNKIYIKGPGPPLKNITQTQQQTLIKEIITMKEIINGKLYNTETANEIAVWSNNDSDYSDFRCIEETLYQKKNGEFFLAAYGGALTKYRRSCGNNSWSGNTLIFPFSDGETKEWLAKHSFVTSYIQLFGEVEE